MMVTLATFLIRCYQAVSRALLPKTCRFHPSCSHYALAAIKKYGIRKGVRMAIARILRCHPLQDGGYDPVR